MFKQYTNKSSVLKRYSRYVQGGKTDIKEKSLGWWERRTDFLSLQPDDIIIEFLPKVYDKRPSLLSYDLYNRDDLAWLILQYNNIVDIEEEFVTGASLRLPNKQRVLLHILNRSVNFTNVNT